MIKQRAVGTAPAVQAVAEALPFSDQVFSVAMAVLSSHHWESRAAAFEEIGRVAARKAVFVTWDPDHEDFWLTQDYFPEIVAIDREIFPPISEFRAAFGAIDVSSLLDPHDCIDGFLGAYWRRPHAYLSSTVRAGMSTFSKISNIDSGLKRLRMDLVSGEWSRRYKHLASKDFVDLGYRIVAAKIH
jgi:SAM-dependent methyltransferase